MSLKKVSFIISQSFYIVVRNNNCYYIISLPTTTGTNNVVDSSQQIKHLNKGNFPKLGVVGAMSSIYRLVILTNVIKQTTNKQKYLFIFYLLFIVI